MRYPRLFITAAGVYTDSRYGTFTRLGNVAHVTDIVALCAPEVQIIVTEHAPWRQNVVCVDCGHKCTVADCGRHSDGITCPKCAVPGGMMPDILWADPRLDVFERQGRGWFWSVGSEYPWGPFPTEEDARFDAEAAIGRVL